MNDAKYETEKKMQTIQSSNAMTISKARQTKIKSLSRA